MKIFALGLTLIALTARGDTQVFLTQPQIDALTPIDDIPTAAVLDPLFVPTADKLASIALTTDDQQVSVQLHAIRSLPMYCPSGDPRPPCGVADPALDSVAHHTLKQLIDAYAALSNPSPNDLLRLRAAIESLGIAGLSAGLQGDVDQLVVFLDHTSRDVRATTARALGSLCNTQAILPLRTRLSGEHIAQVKLAISAALRDLGQCPGN